MEKINIFIRFWRWLLKLLGLYEEETTKEKNKMDLQFKTNETYRGAKTDPTDEKRLIMDIRQGVIVKKKPKNSRERYRIPVKDTDLSKDIA